jgi:hypothetical protein
VEHSYEVGGDNTHTIAAPAIHCDPQAIHWDPQASAFLRDMKLLRDMSFDDYYAFRQRMHPPQYWTLPNQALPYEATPGELSWVHDHVRAPGVMAVGMANGGRHFYIYQDPEEKPHVCVVTIGKQTFRTDDDVPSIIQESPRPGWNTSGYLPSVPMHNGDGDQIYEYWTLEDHFDRLQGPWLKWWARPWALAPALEATPETLAETLQTTLLKHACREAPVTIAHAWGFKPLVLDPDVVTMDRHFERTARRREKNWILKHGSETPFHPAKGRGRSGKGSGGRGRGRGRGEQLAEKRRVRALMEEEFSDHSSDDEAFGRATLPVAHWGVQDWGTCFALDADRRAKARFERMQQLQQKILDATTELREEYNACYNELYAVNGRQARLSAFFSATDKWWRRGGGYATEAEYQQQRDRGRGYPLGPTYAFFRRGAPDQRPH